MTVAYEVFLSIWLGFNLIFGALSAFLANRWGRDPFGWLLVGAVLGPIGFVLLLAEHGRDTRGTRMSIGSVAAGSNARRPSVLIAVDGSEVSDLAVKHVVDRIGTSSGEICVVGVLPIERAEGMTDDESPRRQMLEEEIQRHVGTACATLHDAGIACRSIVRFGDPAAEILKLAREMDCKLLVVGRRGRGKAAKLLLGSVSEKVVREAPCPVTVVG